MEKDQVLLALNAFFKARDEDFMANLLGRHASHSGNKILHKDKFAAALAEVGVKVSSENAEDAFMSADLDGDGGVDVRGLMEAAQRPTDAEKLISNLPLAGMLSCCLMFKGGTGGLKELTSLDERELSLAVEVFSENVKRLLQENIKQLEDLYLAKEESESSEASTKFEFQTFRLNGGGLEDYFAGLRGRVGAPNPDLDKGMQSEHCEKEGCDIPFQTFIHGLVTTPLQEYKIASGEAECPEAELKDRSGKVVRNIQTKNVLMKQEVVVSALLTWLEVLSVVLYSGPMYQVYIAVLRRFPNEFFESFKNNWFPTTIHVLVSAVTKIARSSRISPGLVLYRGLGGQTELPEGFYKADRRGCRGYTEWVFLSTTSDKRVALQYSGVFQGRPAAKLLEITMSSVDHPACIMELSQYPEEREYLFAPCAFLEAVRNQSTMEVVRGQDGRPAGLVEIVSARIHVNNKVETVEELALR